MDTLANTEVGVGVETKKRRLPFEAIAQMDQEKRTEEIEEQEEKMSNALNAFYKMYANRKLPDVRLDSRDKDNLEKIFGYMAETIVDAKFVLGEDRKTYYEFLPPEDKVDLGGKQREDQYIASGAWNSMTIMIGFSHFLDNLDALRQPNKVVATRNNIRVGIGHEVAHFYVGRYYPKKDVISGLASKLADLGDYEYYDKDRAEQFVEKFGQEYAAYKKAEEQRIRAAAQVEELGQ